MSEGDLRATFAMTERDVLLVNRFMWHRKRDTRALYMFMALVGTVLVGGSLVARDGHYWTLALYAAIIAAVTLWLWATPWLQMRQLKGNSTAFAEQEWTFTDSGVRIQARASQSTVGWPDVRRAVESKDYLLLYVSEEQALPIPKHAFRGDEIVRLKERLRQWLGERAEL